MLALPDLPLSPNITRAYVALVYSELLLKKRPAPSRCLPAGAVFKSALVSLFAVAKSVPPFVPPFLLDTGGR